MNPPSNSKRTQVLVAHLFLATGSLGWNLLIWLRPSIGRGWVPFQVGHDQMLHTWLAQVTCLVALPLLIAWAFHRGKPWAPLPMCIVCGSLCYAALQTLGQCILYHNGWRGAGVMLLLLAGYLILTARSMQIR